MSIRKRLATFALTAAALTTGLSGTVMAGTASAHDAWTSYVVDERTDQVGSEFWSGSKFYMHTYTFRNEVWGKHQLNLSVWTTSWVGFRGCVNIEYLDADGRVLGSVFQQLGTTGINGEKRTVYLLFDLSPEVNRTIEHFNIVQWHCPKW